MSNPLTMEQALASPNRKKGWSNGGLIVLNLILTIAQISSYATGYDGSMMSKCNNRSATLICADNFADGLQSLDTWQAYFNNPSPGTLGL